MTPKTTMLNPTQNNTSATPRQSGGKGLARKRNRYRWLESKVFQRKEGEVERVVPNPNKNQPVSHSKNSVGGGHIYLPSPQQQEVGVFGVDSNKRINVWNSSAARVTRALTSGSVEDNDTTDDCISRCNNNANSTNNCHQDTSNNNCESDCESDEDPENTKRVIGMSFDDLFPSSLFEISTGAPQQTSLTLVDILENVIQTGEPSMGIPVVRAGRKRGRNEMATNSSSTSSVRFSIDFLPQFKSCPMFVSSRNVSGVVLLCRSDESSPMVVHGHGLNETSIGNNNNNNNHNNNNLIDMARSLTLPVDKPFSRSVGSSGTCPTENETETETEIDNIDKEIETEIDDSFRTCQIDVSHQTNIGIEVQIDLSTNTVEQQSNSNSNSNSNNRLEALQAFGNSDDSSDDDGVHHNHFFNRASPPLGIGNLGMTDSTDDDCDEHENETDEDYRTLFETVDSVIFGVDLLGNINEWNYKMEELTGISRNDAKGRSLLEDTSLPFLPCECTDTGGSVPLESEVHPVLYRAYSGKSTQQFRLNLKSTTTTGISTKTSNPGEEEKHHGMLRVLVASVSPRYNKRGEVMGALFLAGDFTSDSMMFHSIKTDAHELRKLIDTANAPIFGIDAYGYVNEWNDKTAEITGYGKDDAFGCLLVDTFIFPDIQDSVRAILKNALEHGKGTSNYELEFKTKANEIRHLLVNITPKHDMNNIVVGVVMIAQDVTEAVERDRAVASMALELRQLIETANAPILGIDIHGKVNEWNRRMSTITGFAKEEALNIPLVENFIAPAMKEKVGEILQKALNGNETSNYEVEVHSKSGEPICLLVNATTRRDPDSNVIGVVGVAQDVTEDRKHAKALRDLETVRASQEAKVETERNMTAYFAHELRNPLGAIDSALAAMPDKLPENAQSLVTGMQLCTKFMSSIMNNLLDVRKMEEGKIRLATAPVSIRQMLHNVHEMLSPSVKAAVEFRKLINVKGNDWVLGDAQRIEQVLTNVVSNAIKYTVSGHIQISIEWEKDHVKFICEDTGPGIPKSEQAKLFQRFVQRGGAPGTGLGLAIAKHIVDLTGGSIRFESDPSIKAGTTCIVLMYLPQCKAPVSSAAPKLQDKILEPISVLVIDDIKMNRTMVKRRILKGIAPNAKIKEAATGEEALLICGTDKFDVMIVDQFMEGAGGVMVGTDVVFAMRRMRIDSVLIGCSGNDIGTQFIDAGADMVWQKPMPSNDQIIRDLRSSLDKRGFALSLTGP